MLVSAVQCIMSARAKMVASQNGRIKFFKKTINPFFFQSSKSCFNLSSTNICLFLWKFNHINDI